MTQYSSSNRNRNSHNLKVGRRGVIGLGAAAGATLAAGLFSLSTAPTAHADDFTEILSNETTVFDVGEAQLSTAATDFGSSAIPAGLSNEFAGLFNVTLGGPDNVLLDTIEALAGKPISVALPIALTSPAPTDLAEGLSDAQNWLTIGQDNFSAADTDFLGGDWGDGLANVIAGLNFDLVNSPDDFLVGAISSLLGV